mgnify:CR=1 FL=1
MMVTLLFAMGNIRNVMPGIPGIGIGIDQYGYIWIMILLMASGKAYLSRWNRVEPVEPVEPGERDSAGMGPEEQGGREHLG